MEKRKNKHPKRLPKNQTPDNLKDFIEATNNQTALKPTPRTVRRRAITARVRRIIEGWGLEEIARLVGVRLVTVERWHDGIQHPNASNMRKLEAMPEPDKAGR